MLLRLLFSDNSVLINALSAITIRADCSRLLFANVKANIIARNIVQADGSTPPFSLAIKQTKRHSSIHPLTQLNSRMYRVSPIFARCLADDDLIAINVFQWAAIALNTVNPFGLRYFEPHLLISLSASPPLSPSLSLCARKMTKILRDESQ